MLLTFLGFALNLDIFSHTLWAAAVAKALNHQRLKKPLHVWAAALWGVFPDLFAFTIPAVWLGWQVLFGHLDIAAYPRPGSGQPPPDEAYWPFQLAHILYNVSHSAVVFFAVFGAAVVITWIRVKKDSRYLFFKKKIPAIFFIPWEMGGWLLHILIDIPTHSSKFYPTPVFWPLADWKFRYGFSWGVPWFLAVNYVSIIVVYRLLARRKRLCSR